MTETDGMTAGHLMTQREQQRVQALNRAIADACDDYLVFEILIAMGTMTGRLLVPADDNLAEDTLARFCQTVRVVRQATRASAEG